MISFSCWSFNNSFTIEEIASKILTSPDRQVTNTYSIQFSKIIDFSQTDIPTLNILDKNIKYIYFKLSPLNINPTIVSDMDVVIYEFENNIFVNAFRGYSTAHKLLRQYFTKDTWGELQDRKPAIDEDLLYWMFKSFIDKSSRSPLDSDNSLYVTSLKRYMGITKDQGNTLTGEGDRITEILGTLAFLLNNDLKLLKTKVIYNIGGQSKVHHALVLEIQLKGTIKFDINYYQGDFKNLSIDKLKVAASILITKVIIPIIIKSYQESIINAEWSKSLKRDFIKRIGEEIKERVDTEIEKLNKSIPKVSQSQIATNIGDCVCGDEVAQTIDLESEEIDIDYIDINE